MFLFDTTIISEKHEYELITTMTIQFDELLHSKRSSSDFLYSPH